MTRDEQAAHDAGKLARLMDERQQASGSFSRCPYRAGPRVRAWKQGYQEQAMAARPEIPPDAEERKAKFVSAIDEWLARQKP